MAVENKFRLTRDNAQHKRPWIDKEKSPQLTLRKELLERKITMCWDLGCTMYLEFRHPNEALNAPLYIKHFKGIHKSLDENHSAPVNKIHVVFSSITIYERIKEKKKTQEKKWNITDLLLGIRHIPLTLHELGLNRL